MKICDLCGKETETLTELLERYRSAIYEVDEVCPDCLGQINKTIGFIDSVLVEVKLKTRERIIRYLIRRIRGRKT